MPIIQLTRKKRKQVQKILISQGNDKKWIKRLQFFFSKKNRLRVFSGEISLQDIIRLNENISIVCIGLDLGELKGEEIRFSFDSSQIFGKNSPNKIILNKKEVKKWFNGQTIELKKNKIKKNFKENYVFVEYDNMILGMGKICNSKLLNFVPKHRRGII